MAEVVTCGRLPGKPLPGANLQTGPQDLYSSPKACLAWLEEKRAGLDRVVGRALISTFNTTRTPGASGTSKTQEEGRNDSDDESEYEGEFDDGEGGLSRDLRLCQQAFSAAKIVCVVNQAGDLAFTAAPAPGVETGTVCVHRLLFETPFALCLLQSSDRLAASMPLEVLQLSGMLPVGVQRIAAAAEIHIVLPRPRRRLHRLRPDRFLEVLFGLRSSEGGLLPQRDGEVCFKHSVEERSFKGVFEYSPLSSKQSVHCHKMKVRRDQRIELIGEPAWPRDVGLSLAGRDLKMVDNNVFEGKVRVKKKGRKVNPCCPPNTIPATIKLRGRVDEVLAGENEDMYMKLFGEVAQGWKVPQGGPSDEEDVDDLGGSLQNLFEESKVDAQKPQVEPFRGIIKGNLCVKNNKHLSERVKEELEIDIKDTDKYSCRHFHLSSTKKGLRLQTPLFGVTEAFGEPVSLSGEPLEVINNQGMGTKNHYVVVNMYLMGVSGESVEVMGWFDVKPASTRETLKTVMENDIFNSSD
ncbi:hypothetical protein FOZ62_031178 [Perkinsus olseni]|uniref:Uncharacterized protein n=2 Tax=Perkinsus olseni TaxID=32597 RepID=A0A7J6S1Z5_PEROL|nr:hypothetical protein FOZ62_031178 [Perkinsus olseni]